MELHYCIAENGRPDIKRGIVSSRKDGVIRQASRRFIEIFNAPDHVLQYPFPTFPLPFSFGVIAIGSGMIVDVLVDDLVGIGSLILPGKNAEREQEFCIQYQHRTSFPTWRLPIPPLEIDTRPFCYHVTFPLAQGRKCKMIKNLALRYINGVAVAFSSEICKERYDN